MNETIKLILSLSLSGSILAVLIFALKPFIKHKLSKSIQYYIWIVVVLRLVLPFSFEGSTMNNVFYGDQTPVAISIQSEENASNPSILPNVQENVTNGVYNGDVDHSRYFRDLFNQYVIYLWLLGIIIALTVNLTGYARFFEHLKQANKPAADEENRILAALLNGRNNVRLVRNRFSTTPMLIGILRPYIIIPDINFNEKQLKNILLHEIAHLKHFDIGVKWLTMIATSIHWFNPLVYFLKKEINHACELACDEAVIKGLNPTEKQAYADTLISVVAEHKYPIGVLQATMSEEKETLKERLVAIMKYNKKSKSIMLISVVLLIAVISGAVLLGACSGKTNKDVTNEEKAAVASIVEGFGSKLQMVSLSDPKDIVEKSMQDNYGTLVSQALIKEWISGISDPLNVPGRLTSSPWPDRIEILSTEKLSADEYKVSGKIIEMTSVEKLNGGVAAKRPTTLVVRKIENRWIIDDVTLGAYDVTLEQPPKQSANANLLDTEILEVANKWAETWQSRDGKARYELMSSKMQKVFYEQQIKNNGKEGVWVIGGSSPWVESYDIHLDGEQAVITYRYSDSTRAKYEGVERLFLSKENGKVLVINAVMEKEMDQLTGVSLKSDFDILLQNPNFQKQGFEIIEMKDPVKINKETAIKTATVKETIGTYVSEQAKNTTAVLVKYTNKIYSRLPGSDAVLQDLPVWIVTIHDVNIPTSGGPKIPNAQTNNTPKVAILGDANVIIDANTGKWIETFSYSK